MKVIVLADVTDLVVLIEEPKGGSTVFISIDAHHGLCGRSKRILQVRPPGLILTGVGPTLVEGRLIGHHYNQPLTGTQTRTDINDPADKASCKSAILHTDENNPAHCTFCESVMYSVLMPEYI